MEITISNHLVETESEVSCGVHREVKLNGVKSITIYFEPGETNSEPNAKHIVEDVCATVIKNCKQSL